MTEAEKEEAEKDFNLFVGAETGILKGINVNRKLCIAKNFRNFTNLSKVRQLFLSSNCRYR